MLGMAGVKYFRQEQVLHERGDVGNFINLPYFDAEQTLRHAILEDGSAASLEGFLISPTVVPLLRRRSSRLPSGLSRTVQEWAPCLNCMLGGAFWHPQHGDVCRCGWVQKEQPETWKQRLEEINQRFANPPLPASEIVTIQNQHDKKDCGFPCDQEPLRNFCNKTLCKTKKLVSAARHVSGRYRAMCREVRATGLVLRRGWSACRVDNRRSANAATFSEGMHGTDSCHASYDEMQDWRYRHHAHGRHEPRDVPHELTYKGRFASLSRRIVMADCGHGRRRRSLLASRTPTRTRS